MDESAEIQGQQVATQFGRWADVDEWFKETRGIKEKIRLSKEVETIPVPGTWHLCIYIPIGAEDDYANALETAMSLLAAMGTRPENAYLEGGYCVIWLKPAEFHEAKALAVQVRRWLASRAFKTTVVEGYPALWEAGVPVHLKFEHARNYAKRVEELSELKRLRARLTGSTENLTVVLTRGQVEGLIDLVEECETKWCDPDLIDAEILQILEHLDKLSGALGTVLRPGTTDSRGPL